MLHIVLYQPEIPHNTGAVGRLCLAAGARLHLIKPLGFSLEDRYLKRSGLDYWPEVDLRLWDTWQEFEAQASHPVFCFTTKATRTSWQAEYPAECSLVFGPETRGLPEPMLQARADTCLRIPMRQEARSLNLATAVAIGMYEALRQNGSLGLPLPAVPLE